MITFIATAFNEIKNIDIYISCLLCQTNDNWKTIFYHNGENEEFRKSLKFDQFILECLACKKRQSELMCKECLLPFCENCYERVHDHRLKNHEITYNHEIK